MLAFLIALLLTLATAAGAWWVLQWGAYRVTALLVDWASPL